MSPHVDDLIAAMTLDEKASLTAGEDLWSTPAVARVGIAKVRVTDGPNGARGPVLPGPGMAPSICIPCGSALGATWDPDLVGRVGALIADDARAKGCHVLLAPTVNIHRSPLAGRNFECYSEDPLLSGQIAVGFIRGVQSRGVATTVKHFAGNDAETERTTMSSVIDERTLREIYLVPFELAVRDGGSLGVMTGYNRLNGVWCAEHAPLLRDILRGEWGFQGFVVTDWFSVASSAGSLDAGVDLEMPGPGRAFGQALADAVRSKDVDEDTLDGSLRRLLGVFDHLGALSDPLPETSGAPDSPESRALAREAAAAAMVLLKNDGVLPLDPAALTSVAVIGPNAGRPIIMGGGSASLRPHYRVNPLTAIRERLGDAVHVTHERGAAINRSTPTLGGPALVAPDGSEGMGVEYFAGHDLTGAPLLRRTMERTEIFHLGPPAPDFPQDYSMRARTTWTPPDSGTYVVTLVQIGRARLFANGELLLDGNTNPPGRGDSHFGLGSAEMVTELGADAGQPIEFVIEASNASGRGGGGARLGCALGDPGNLIERAAAAARSAEVAIVVVGTDAEWETEGNDRASMDLPGAQDSLISAVVEANPHTIVVVNAGSPVTMPWAGKVPAIVQAWFGGQEMAPALAEVLVGDVDPGGRLPTTFPVRLEHNPSYGNFPGEDDEVRYGEGLLVGYRWYDARHLPVSFAFGHGLSYTTFELGAPTLSSETFSSGEALRVSVPVTNTGTRRGAEVVQVYVGAVTPSVVRPVRELRGFAKVWLDPGAIETVVIDLDDRAFAYWDTGAPDHAAVRARLPLGGGSAGTARGKGWRVEPGAYVVSVGRSSADLRHAMTVTVAAG